MFSTSLRLLCALAALVFAIGCGSSSEGTEAPAPAASAGDEASGDAPADSADAEEPADEDGAKVGEASGSNAARDAKMKILKAREAAGDEQAADDEQ
jgi:hypothetical protein